MTRRILATRRRPAPRLLCAQLWRPRSLAPLTQADRWLLAVALCSDTERVDLAEVLRIAVAAGCELSARDVGIAALQLHRRGLGRRHGSRSHRLSLTAAGRLVARLEAAHLPVAPTAPNRLKPAQAPAVEVWRCARRPAPTPFQEVRP